MGININFSSNFLSLFFVHFADFAFFLAPNTVAIKRNSRSCGRRSVSSPIALIL